MPMPQLYGAPMLLGLGAEEPIDSFLLMHPKPSSSDVADFLKAYPPEQRATMAQSLMARGVEAKTVAAALNWLDASAKIRGNWPTIAGVLSMVSGAASGYHGYKRNQSIGWALVWFTLGSIFPIVTPVIAVAQGFGKRKGA